LTVSQDHLLAFIDQHLARRREHEHRVAYRFVSSDDCAALDVERAVASIRDEAAKPHGNAPVYVNSSIADAVMAALHAADPRRWVIHHPIVRPPAEVAGRPGPRLAGRGDAHWAGTSVEDAAAELAVARAQERIARQREGN
jgi:hypothetical protein